MADKREIRTSAAPAPIGSHSQRLVVGDFLHTATSPPTTRFTARTSPPFPVRTTVGSGLMNIVVEIDFVVYVGR